MAVRPKLETNAVLNRSLHALGETLAQSQLLAGVIPAQHDGFEMVQKLRPHLLGEDDAGVHVGVFHMDTLAHHAKLGVDSVAGFLEYGCRKDSLGLFGAREFLLVGEGFVHQLTPNSMRASQMPFEPPSR